jgi:hypothetical protein
MYDILYYRRRNNHSNFASNISGERSVHFDKNSVG